MIDLNQPHRRRNALTGEWVLVSPHRAKRPWLGQVERLPDAILPAYDPGCYLCPGNNRAGGKSNPKYFATHVFENDFPALLPPKDNGEDRTHRLEESSALFLAHPESGICQVVCFSPRHDLTLPELSLDEVKSVVGTWSAQTDLLASRADIAYVQVFENKGEMMGCSNPHPHSQIWATSHVPVEPAKELAAQAEYTALHDSCLLCDYLEAENREGLRIVAQNDDFTACVPFWAVWPFEILVISNQHCGALMDLSTQQTAALADILRKVSTRYDNLFEISFPYSMGFHQSPADDHSYPAWHLHAHYYPPLLRSASVRKFMVGFEMLGMPQRDITPEAAAEKLRSLSEVHYKQR